MVLDKKLQMLQQHFDSLAQRTDSDGIEFWFARDLQPHLGYARWENFQTAIIRSVEACRLSGFKELDHFRGVTKMVLLGSGAKTRRVTRRRGSEEASAPSQSPR